MKELVPDGTELTVRSLADIPLYNGDLDVDVHLGTQWLRQDAPGSFSTQTGVPLSSGVPDRVVLGDIDGDTDLDVVIGVEFAQGFLIAKPRPVAEFPRTAAGRRVAELKLA